MLVYYTKYILNLLAYFLRYALFFFHIVAKKFLIRHDKAYRFMLLLNTLWLCFLICVFVYWAFYIPLCKLWQ